MKKIARQRVFEYGVFSFQGVPSGDHRLATELRGKRGLEESHSISRQFGSAGYGYGGVD
jgi:hypothetical protein